MKLSTRLLSLVALAGALLVLVPTALAQPAPGTTTYAVLGANRFPGGQTTAVGTLRFVTDTLITLDVDVTGTDLRNWTVRVYSRGNCSLVLNWVGTRGVAGQLLLPVATNGNEAPQALFAADVERIHAALERGEPLALMLAGAGAGGVTEESPYRTCTNFGTTPPVTTSTTATSSATSTATATTASTITSTTSSTTSTATATTATSSTVATTTIVTSTATATTVTTLTTATSTSTTTVPALPPLAAPIAASTAEDTPSSPIALIAIDNASPTTFTIVAGPSHGSLGPISSPVCVGASSRLCIATVTYAPDPDYNGPDSFTYRANDGSLDSNVATVAITVTPVNDAPVAVPDSFTTDEDTPLVVPAPGVLGNDTDVDGDALSASLVTGPTHGTLVLGSDGSFTYSPDAGYGGADAFTYTAGDGLLDSSEVTVSIQVDAVVDRLPGVQIVKFVNGEDSDTPTGPHAAAGGTVTFTYVVTNTGNVPLADVTVTDDKLGTITSFTGDTNANSLLNLTETWTYTATGTTLVGQQTNIGTVNARDARNPPGTAVSDSNPANYFGDAAAINVVKFVNGESADTPTGPHVPAGSTVTFTYVVTNTGNVPLASVAVTDDKLGAIAGPASGDTNGNNLLDLTETWTYTQTATAIAGQQTNVGSVSAQDANNPPATTVMDDNSANYFGDVVDLSLTKDDGVLAAQPGDTLTYTLTIRNVGSLTATGVTVTDTPPINTSFVSASDGGTFATGVVSWTIASLGAGATATRTLTVTVDNTVPAGVTSITNTATVVGEAANGVDPTPADNTGTDTDTVTAAPDLTLTKDDGVATAQAGQTLTYTLTIRNVGNQNTTGVTVTDTLPANTSFVSASDGGTLTDDEVDWTIGSIAAGATATRTLTVQVNDPLPAGVTSIANSATVSDDGTNGTDPTPADNTGTDTDDVLAPADLSITKDDGVVAVAPGQTLTYTLTIRNVGGLTATGVTVSDTLPINTSFVSASDGGTFAAGVVTWTIASLGAGATATRTVSVQVDDPLAADVITITNTATVTPQAGTTDPDTDNNTATDTDFPTRQADLSITKTDLVASVVAGTDVTYTIVVANEGPGTASNATVADPFPTALSDVSWTSTASPGASGNDVSGSGDINDTGITLAPSATITYTVTGTVDPLATGTLVNTATVIAGAGTIDTDQTNDSATDTDLVTVLNDFNFSKTDNIGFVVAGGSTTYSISLQTFGPSGFSNVTISDPLPAGVTSATWTATNGHSGTGAINDPLGDLPPGTSITYTMTVQVSSTATGVLLNRATFSSDSGVFDDADIDVIVSLPVFSVADLSITKTDGSGTAVPGTSITYTITVTNNGPNTVSSLTVIDTVPAALSDAAFGPPSGGSYDPATGLWSGLSLAAGQSVAIQLGGTISPTATGSLANSATVSPPSGTIDINPANNAATDTDTLTLQADVSITVTDGVAQVTAGTSTTYTATITNNGPSAARVNTEHLVTLNGNLVANPSRSLGILAPGATETNIFTYSVPPNTAGILMDVASIRVVFADDLNPANDTATDVDTVVLGSN